MVDLKGMVHTQTNNSVKVSVLTYDKVFVRFRFTFKYTTDFSSRLIERF